MTSTPPLPRRRSLLLATALTLTLGSAVAQPESYPARPIKLVVGFAPGGPVDTAARAYGEHLAQALGQPVLIDNKSGAGGTIASDLVAQSVPDGYTLYFGASSTLTMAPWLQRNRGADADKAFEPLGQVTSFTNVLLVRADAPYKSVADLLERARQNPGKVSFGSAGVGTSSHLAAEFLRQSVHADMTHVPYRGNAPALNDLMAGQIDFMFDITGTAVGQVKGGKVRALAVTSRSRNAALPEVPTVIESGVKDYDVTGWFALLGPKGLPAEVNARLVKAHAAVCDNADFKAQMARGGYDMVSVSQKALAERLKRELALWGSVVKAANIQPE